MRGLREGFIQKIGLAVGFGSFLLVSGCALTRAPREYSLKGNASTEVERASRADSAERIEDAGDGSQNGTGSRPLQATTVPRLADAPRDVAGAQDGVAPELGVGEVDTVVPPLILPAFIDLVFGELLSVPYTTGPGVASREEIVQLRSSGAMPANTFLELVRSALKDYGVQVAAENGVFQIIEDAALVARQPRFVRSRSRSDTPANLRPVVQFVELNAIDASSMSSILRQALGSQSNANVKIEADTSSNFIILSGLPEDVNAALTIIYEMDELQYAGTQVQRYSPRYWDVNDLAGELEDILSAEGWQVSRTRQSPKPILLLPIDRSNDLLVFTRESTARQRVSFWVNELDRPATKGDAPQVFVYPVRNVDASRLAETVNQVVSGISAKTDNPRQIAARAAAAAAAGGGPGATDRPGSGLIGGFVVDPSGNRLIFSGTPTEYEQLLPLLRELDRAPSEVLIEVMIAQVNLTDTTQYGVDWTIRNLNDNALRNNFGSGSDPSSGLDGLVSNGTFGPAGLAFGVFAPDVNVSISALAENNQVNVLSTPRLLARSGSSASVQVGSDVPILTTQTSPVGGGVSDVISNVEYRSTGIILTIEPIVFSDDRIDLTISQEISSTLPGGGPVASPSFSNTSVSTLLSLEDGGTAVIGGLIQDNVSRNESGVPVMKDIPLLGNLFSSESFTVDRTELVILITAYVIRGQEDKEAFAEKFTAEIDATLGENNFTTLRPRQF